MVLFANINIGQKVQVLYKGEVYSGIVKYKGGLANTKGDWVGVELDLPVGKHNGIYKGRQYFSCRTNHGIFVHPSNVRFNYLKRWYFDTYLSVSPTSFVDDTLFHTPPRSRSPGPYDPKAVSESYSNLAKDGFSDVLASWHAGMQCKSSGDSFYVGPKSPTFSRRHSIGRTFKPPEKSERPKTAMGTETFRSSTGLTVRSSTYRLRRSLDLDPSESINRSFSPEIGSPTRMRKFTVNQTNIQFASSPSMPKIHMPLDTLRLQDERGWENTHKPREWTL